MRIAAAGWLLALGCKSEPAYVPPPLPPLVTPRAAADLPPLRVDQLGFTPGERFVYMVRVRGFSIGSVELTAGQGEIRSTFATSLLAGAFSSVKDDLVTTLDGSRPATSHERLVIDGQARELTKTYTGTASHSLHTALGAIRTWAKRGATAAFLTVAIPDRTVRVELSEPSGGKDWLRVDGTIVGLDAPATFTCWLDTAHVITRVEVRMDSDQVTADLVQ